ncbi:MAG: TIGR01906 family membrane protein [Anaerolineales bacterium]|jgi:integral membrane protein (TIGR01906 family)
MNDNTEDTPVGIEDLENAEGRWESKLLIITVMIFVPVFLALTSVRLVMTPALIQFEYNQPGFPPDPYGFTKEDRLYWSRIALDYLLNSEDISFLGDLEFANGAPVYNARELRHMLDVKNTVTSVLYIWYISLAALVLLGAWAWHSGRWVDFKIGLSRGGVLTMTLIGAILFFVLLSFGVLFVAFHNVFFQPGTWTFLFSDTLIRLFPERFWRDVFLIVGGLSFAGGFLLMMVFKNKKSL